MDSQTETTPLKTDTPETVTPGPSTTGSLVKKLARIVSEIDHVDKRGTNEFHKYKYVKAADLAHAARKKLADANVILLSSVIYREDSKYETKNGETYLLSNIQVRYTFHDGDSGEQLSFDMPGSGADKGDKGIYKAITGSLKYALRNAFLVPDDSDPEADSSIDKATAKEAQARVAAEKTQGKVQTMPANPNLGGKLQASIDLLKEKTRQVCEFHLNQKSAYLRFSPAAQARVGDALKEAKAIFDKHLNCYIAPRPEGEALVQMFRKGGIECFACDGNFTRTA